MKLPKVLNCQKAQEAINKVHRQAQSEPLTLSEAAEDLVYGARLPADRHMDFRQG